MNFEKRKKKRGKNKTRCVEFYFGGCTVRPEIFRIECQVVRDSPRFKMSEKSRTASKK